MRHAAAAPPPVEVTAPMCVHAVTMRQRKNGERLIVHLFNDISTTAGHGYPAEEVPLREEVLPIHDIRIRFRRRDIKSIHLEPAALPLGMMKVDEGIEVLVPKLAIHALVVADLR
jgi:hypothetical protein